MIKLKNILSEAEMVLRRKGGKTVTFTNKDNYEKAKKSGDYESPDKKKYTKQDVDSDMYAQDTWKRFGGDTGKDADSRGEPPEGSREPDDVDYGGGDFTKSADYDMWSDEDPEDAGEPDFYDPEDYEKLYPDKTKPKDEVGDIKYGKGFSPDSDHMFDSVAGSASSASDKYSELLDSVKSGNWKQFRSRIHDIYDEDAREHLLNLANHVDSGTYNDEFPKGKKGLEFGRKEVMDLFRQAADYGDEQFPVDPDDIDDLPGGSEKEPEDDGPPFDDPGSDDNWWKKGGKKPIDDEKLESWIDGEDEYIEYFKSKGKDKAAAEHEESKAEYQRELDRRKEKGGADEKEESITINGKKYRPIKESVEPTIFDPHKEAKKQLGGLYSRMIGK